MQGQKFTHVPIMVTEVLELLSPLAGESVLDVTLGLGGHSAEFLKAVGDSGSLTGLDADSQNLADAEDNLLQIPGAKKFLHVNFSELEHLHLESFDVIFADLGMSSAHVDDPKRGFTFREDVPLDLRYDRTSGKNATELIAQLSEQDLFILFKKYGELKQARRISKAIIATDIKTTGDLRVCIEESCGHFAASILPQVFQSLRIAVNDELGSLESLLKTAPDLLSNGGRFGVITFHSLEDRLVKHAFKELTTGVKNELTGAIAQESEFVLLTKKPICPCEEECADNPRARSAKLRVIQKRDS